EVLHHDACGRELDLGAGLRRGVPRTERLDLLARDVRTVLGAQQVLEQDLQAEGQLVVPLDRIDAVDLIVGAPDRQGALGTEAVHRGHGRLLLVDRRIALPSSSPVAGRASKAALTLARGSACGANGLDLS